MLWGYANHGSRLRAIRVAALRYGILLFASCACGLGLMQPLAAAEASTAQPPAPSITVEPETPTLNMKLTNGCGWLSDVLLGPGPCEAKHFVYLRGDPSIPSLTGDIQVIGVGPDGATFDAAGPLRVSLVDSRLEARITDQEGLAPGHYAGRVIAKFKGAASPLQVPFDINVRIGPLSVLICIVVGVLVGQLARFMRERGDKEGAFRRRYDRLHARAGELPQQDQVVLKPLERQAIEKMDAPDLKDADSALSDLERGIQLLESAEDILRLWPTAPEDDKKSEEAIRAAIATRDLDLAKKILDGLQQNFRDNKGAPAVVAKVSAAAVVTVAPIGGVHGLLGKARSIRAPRATIVSIWRAIIVPYVVPPALKLALLILLILTGMQILYVDGSATFGAHRLADYLALLTWGLSADVASRSLIGFASTK
jgi:hypothetical protein